MPDQRDEHNSRKLALLIEYEGSRYSGFQIQANAPTIQGVMEQALDKITGEGNRLKGASRTDTGVHALGQVATFVTATQHSARTFVGALNSHLPEDVAVRASAETAPCFDVRRHALTRRYRYVLLQRRTPSPLLRAGTHRVRRPLDVEAMATAAGTLLGRHDFASFSAKLSNQTSTVREITRVGFSENGDLLFFDIEANAFLPQQVRRTVGELIAVGAGEQPVERIRQLLQCPILGAASSPVPPHGLYLMEIAYAPDALRFDGGASAARSSGWAAGISLPRS